jgi:alkanesulfonate monooxygenase
LETRAFRQRRRNLGPAQPRPAAGERGHRRRRRPFLRGPRSGQVAPLRSDPRIPAAVRRLWREEDVTFDGEYFSVEDSTLEPRTFGAEEGRHPKLYFGGASAAAEEVAAAEADVQLFWGEPLDGIAERIERLNALSEKLDREHPPLEYGLRVTTLVRDTSEEAWHDAEAKVAELAGKPSVLLLHNAGSAEGQRRLSDLAGRGEVLDSCLYTTPSKYGGEGAGTTWLVGSAAEVAAALQKYRDLGVRHFILSDTPYLPEVSRIGEQVLPLLRDTAS